MSKRNQEGSLVRSLTRAIETESVVKCIVCGKFHPVGSSEYVAIFGNVMVGAREEIVGGNIDPTGKLVGSTIYCLGECFASLAQTTVDAVSPRAEELVDPEVQRS